MATFPQWLPWALLSAAFAALTAIFAKLGLQQVDADLAMLLRTVAIVAVLGLFVAATGKWSNPLALPGKTLLWLLLSALATGASWLCYFRAIQVGELAKVAVVDKTSVVLVLLFAVVFLGEKPSGRDWLGMLLVLSGLAMLAFRR